MAGHKFNPEKVGHLDSPIRKLLLPATKMLSDLKPSKNEAWADIGAGSGFYTIPLASIVDKVYALDISAEMLDLLQKKLKQNQVTNVVVKRSEETSIPLANKSVDGVLLAFVAHELDDPAKYFKEISRTLKPNGRVVIIEYAKVKSFGPPLSHRLDPQEVDKWAHGAGLKKGKTWQWSRAIVGWEYINKA
jgi:ubiquinone/menaquinone biosynthesis C-methylase UbiE